jgi:ABC-type bacteriocin/lantibiotic exporter with double-glycine peptidase domain
MPVGFKLPAKVRKNILLIRALLGEHRLLLLEEPFEHLSEPYRRNMINYIRTHRGATVFIASAHENLAEDCDRNILLNNEGYLISIK